LHTFTEIWPSSCSVKSYLTIGNSLNKTQMNIMLSNNVHDHLALPGYCTM